MEQDNYTRGKPTSTSTNTSPNAPKKSDLMSSAKVMADAAKSAFAKDTEKIDKAKVAGAAADLLGAAKHYGKLEENNNNFGKYVGKAETYLHQYHSSHHAPAPHASTTQHGGTYGNSSGAGAGTGSGSGSGGGYGEYVKLAQGFLNKKQDHGGEGGASGGHSSGGGGAGDYIKLAQGLLNKKQGHGGEGGNGHSSSGGGAEEYIKLAQGFLNKKH